MLRIIMKSVMRLWYALSDHCQHQKSLWCIPSMDSPSGVLTNHIKKSCSTNSTITNQNAAAFSCCCCYESNSSLCSNKKPMGNTILGPLLCYCLFYTGPMCNDNHQCTYSKQGWQSSFKRHRVYPNVTLWGTCSTFKLIDYWGVNGIETCEYK